MHTVVQQKVDALLSQMSLAEKIGQTVQVHLNAGPTADAVLQSLKEGKIGSFLNDTDVNKLNELQRIAVEETRLGIPLLMGRDVIHGFRTLFPIPLGQAASWNPSLVQRCARIAAIEAAKSGINWTFAPMVDMCRDPRWGRIAETLGEDPYLCGQLAVAMAKGFQGDSLSEQGSIAACAKHYAGYGACEAGRDYDTTNIPLHELRNIHFAPFAALAQQGIASFMTSFSDLNGTPATGNAFLLRDVLRDEWQYQGFVVSDWNSVHQLCTHGICENDRHAALTAATAGVDMDMVSGCYANHLQALVEAGELAETTIDTMAARILSIKFELGLFEQPYTNTEDFPAFVNAGYRQAAKEAAIRSTVLLKNDNSILPLNKGSIKQLALIGPLADDPYEQLGTWIFDGDETDSITVLSSLHQQLDSDVHIEHIKGLATTRSHDTRDIGRAVAAAEKADAVIAVLGEESILSGEAHCRADINLPGAQQALLEAVSATGTPVIVVIMAGRPLTIGAALESCDALLYAWHPGTMGGPALVDLIFGKAVPSAKLPVTFPNMVGQIPIYYNRKPGGKPATEKSFVHVDHIPVRSRQTSVGDTCFHLDAGYKPLFPFGFGLSYTEFEYSNLELSTHELKMGGSLYISVQLRNIGTVAAEEISQLYIRDPIASRTRPVKELKGFCTTYMEPGESKTITFNLTTAQLGVYADDANKLIEPGEFHIGVGTNSETSLSKKFILTKRS